MSADAFPLAEADRLSHEQVQGLMVRLGDAQVINLDTAVRDLMRPVSEILASDAGAALSYHIVCCSDYALITK